MEGNDNIKTNLISKQEKDQKINEGLLIKDNIQNNEDNIPKMNEDIINTNQNLYLNQPQQNYHQQINEYLITIQYSKCLHIPYFIFSNIFHFYFPCKRFHSNQIKLSEMPTPPFAVVRSECKFIILNI